MKTEMRQIPVSDLVNGYEDRNDDGVVGYGGKLDIRPPYQREFVYNAEQQQKVIDSIRRGFPLGEMHWFVRDDDTYEIIDGQQRTISIAQYIEGEFALDDLYFHNLTEAEQTRIRGYALTVYLFRGTDRQRLEWFERINTTGESLKGQEILNAVYAGPWVSDARRYFSKRDCVAYKVGHQYLKGSAIRQDYLEAVLKWVSDGDIVGYMGRHQHDEDAKPLWEYFQSVIDWIERIFTAYRRPMEGVDWGSLYNKYKDADLDPVAIEEEIKRLIQNEDVTRQAGIYPYILTRDEKHLNIRAFPEPVKRRVYERQKGKCAMCGDAFDIKDMHADHIKPWIDGGKTEEKNCQMLCREDNQQKGSK